MFQQLATKLHFHYNLSFLKTKPIIILAEFVEVCNEVVEPAY